MKSGNLIPKSDIAQTNAISSSSSRSHSPASSADHTQPIDVVQGEYEENINKLKQLWGHECFDEGTKLLSIINRECANDPAKMRLIEPYLKDANGFRHTMRNSVGVGAAAAQQGALTPNRNSFNLAESKSNSSSASSSSSSIPSRDYDCAENFYEFEYIRRMWKDQSKNQYLEDVRKAANVAIMTNERFGTYRETWIAEEISAYIARARVNALLANTEDDSDLREIAVADIRNDLKAALETIDSYVNDEMPYIYNAFKMLCYLGYPLLKEFNREYRLLMRMRSSEHPNAGELAFCTEYLYPVIVHDMQELARQFALTEMAITAETSELIGKIRDFDASFNQASFTTKLNAEIETSRKQKIAAAEAEKKQKEDKIQQEKDRADKKRKDRQAKETERKKKEASALAEAEKEKAAAQKRKEELQQRQIEKEKQQAERRLKEEAELKAKKAAEKTAKKLAKQAAKNEVKKAAIEQTVLAHAEKLTQAVLEQTMRELAEEAAAQVARELAEKERAMKAAAARAVRAKEATLLAATASTAQQHLQLTPQSSSSSGKAEAYNGAQNPGVRHFQRKQQSHNFHANQHRELFPSASSSSASSYVPLSHCMPVIPNPSMYQASAARTGHVPLVPVAATPMIGGMFAPPVDVNYVQAEQYLALGLHPTSGIESQTYVKIAEQCYINANKQKFSDRIQAKILGCQALLAACTMTDSMQLKNSQESFLLFVINKNLLNVPDANLAAMYNTVKLGFDSRVLLENYNALVQQNWQLRL